MKALHWDGSALRLRTDTPLPEPNEGWARGTLVLKSTVAAEHTLSLAPLVINEGRVIGSRCGLFPVALEALAKGQIDVESLVHGTFDVTVQGERIADLSTRVRKTAHAQAATGL